MTETFNCTCAGPVRRQRAAMRCRRPHAVHRRALANRRLQELRVVVQPLRRWPVPVPAAQDPHRQQQHQLRRHVRGRAAPAAFQLSSGGAGRSALDRRVWRWVWDPACRCAAWGFCRQARVSERGRELFRSVRARHTTRLYLLRRHLFVPLMHTHPSSALCALCPPRAS